MAVAMDVQIGDVWLCPFDFPDKTREFRELGAFQQARVLTDDYRRKNHVSHYQAVTQGKFRPVVILGMEHGTNRYLAVPLYTHREEGLAVDAFKKQVAEAEHGRKILTIVAVDPLSDVKPKTKRANEIVLEDPSIARVDEIRAVPAQVLSAARGRVEGEALEQMVAAYLWLVWEAGIPEVLKKRF